MNAACGNLFSPHMPPRKKTVAATTSATQVTPQTTKIETALLKIRDICRDHGLQIWDKQSLSDQIYQDLLFFYHCPRLQREGLLQLNLADIGNGQLSEFTLAAIVALKDDKLMSSAVKDLWRELQESAVKPLFADRQFKMFAIEKNEKKAPKYYVLLRALLTYMASITLDSYDSNAGYTYFKKDLNKGTAKTFGQFYTPPTVLKSVVDLVDPCVGESVLDPSSGSCSFLQESASHIMRAGASREKAFATLYGIEVEPNIYAEGIMNIFINFGFLPDMKKNIREEDAFLELLRSETRYDKIVANPPFGADAKSFHDFYMVMVMEPPKKAGGRMKKDVQQNPEVKTTIPFTQTKESAILFFQLIIQSLKVGGKAGVVMSSTILNDGHKEMIEWFLKCCSLEKVVINPAGTFKDQGTGIETFSFIFTKGKPTTAVEIVMLGAENDAVRTLTLDQIKEAGWKLQLKEEEKKVVYTGKYKLIPFEQMVTGKNGKNIPEEKRLENGLYPYYASNGVKGSVNDFNFEGPSVLIGDQGSSWARSIHYVTDGQKFYAGNHTIVLKANGEVNIRYIYYLLSLSNLSVFGKESAVIPEMNKELFYKSQQSNVPLPIQQEIVTNLDRIFADPQDMKDCIAFTDKAMDLMLKDPTGKQLEDVLGGLRLKRAYLNDAASVKSQMAAVVRSVGARGFERKKLGDIAKVLFGERITQKDNTGTIYPVYGSGYDTFKTDKSNRDGKTCKLGRFAISETNMAMIVNGPYWLMDSGFTVESMNEEVMLKEFLWNLLLTDKNRLSQCSTGSCQKNIEMDRFYTLEYPCPPLPIQHEVLAILNEMEAELQTLEQMAAKAEKRAKFILDSYLNTA